jgi:hypothetical protein
MASAITGDGVAPATAARRRLTQLRRLVRGDAAGALALGVVGASGVRS